MSLSTCLTQTSPLQQMGHVRIYGIPIVKLIVQIPETTTVTTDTVSRFIKKGVIEINMLDWTFPSTKRKHHYNDQPFQ